MGWIYEHSPWISEKVYNKRPFASKEELLSHMKQAVESASEEEKLGLLRAYPDLGARVKMADASVSEQKGAGLDQLNEEEYKDFLAMNKEYT
ncbi:2-oxo-4-hydroxy-4-carboxy-5-ureidoimidazoline decarboxylase, partial [Paraburkholderia sp. SIMBA_055]